MQMFLVVFSLALSYSNFVKNYHYIIKITYRTGNFSISLIISCWSLNIKICHWSSVTEIFSYLKKSRVLYLETSWPTKHEKNP